jgi:hypothetical protein
MFSPSLLVLSILIVAPLTAQAGQPYVNKEFNFSVIFPDGWQAVPPERLKGNIRVHMTGSETYGSGMFISIAASNLPPMSTLDTYYKEHGLKADTNILTDPITKTGASTINGVKCRWADAVVDVSGKIWRVKFYYLVKNNRGYLISTGADPALFDLYSFVFENTIKSFKIGP